MKKLNFLTRKAALGSMLAAAILVTSVSCTQDEEPAQVDAGVIEDIPTALENFNEEIEFTEKDEDGKKSWRTYRKVPTFRTLITALIKTDLLRTVAKNKLTIIAPTDQAFRELGITPWNVAEVENLKEILLYHVIEGKVYSNSLEEGYTPTLNGAYVKVSLTDGVFFDDSEVVRADKRALNGVIHIVDAVMFPPSMDIVEKAISFNPDEFNALVQAVVQAELVETLQSEGPFTVFAPTDEAFAAAGIDLATISKEDLTAVLLYHVVAGRVFSTDLSNGFVETAGGASVEINTDNGVFVNTSQVVIPDVQTTNGVIHVIDEVLLPPTMNIVEKAISFNPDEFNTLVAAVLKAELAETLQSDGPFTVFAPTDGAFAAKGIDLDAVSKEDLTNILLYHVVPGKVFSTDLTNGMVATANGQEVTISIDGGVTVNEASVIIPNVQTTNGVIHVINDVLLP
jgi:transforming growth factor-beta-induced protein